MQPPANMLSSQETIERLQSKILELSLEKHSLERKLREVSSVDETKRDFLADLYAQNEELRQRLQEYEKGGVSSKKIDDEQESEVEKRDAASQTNLDRLNIDQLIEASLTLKRQKREKDSNFKRPSQHSNCQSSNQYHSYHQSQPQYQGHSQNHHHHHHAATMPRPEQQPKVVSQLLYPHVTLPQPTSQSAVQSNHKAMSLDEKEALQKLFKVDGVLTTLRDQLRAQQN